MSSSTVNENLTNHNQEPNMVNDPLHLASSDHPGMNLTNTLFTDLWKELEERYGQSNGPLIYHVERELSKVSQGNSTIAAYFNKLKRFWDELHSLNGVPMCSCGKMRECTCEKIIDDDCSSSSPVPNNPTSSSNPVSSTHEEVLSTPATNSTETNNHEDIPLVVPTSDVPINDSIPVRRSSRTVTQPTWLKDFVTTKHRAVHARIDTPNRIKLQLLPLLNLIMANSICFFYAAVIA
ncbi:hypothetical protein CTI12_AA178990 [Artemisia annua]|uniref:Uncharacterized protein n=1 Tax=Artemisia annua TaxID=35608 RepID=A0A2U1P5R9_ARTAN|nr:hypothetical protein CTI12_AA178990 [Artemisia annua]